MSSDIVFALAETLFYGGFVLSIGGSMLQWRTLPPFVRNASVVFTAGGALCSLFLLLSHVVYAASIGFRDKEAGLGVLVGMCFAAACTGCFVEVKINFSLGIKMQFAGFALWFAIEILSKTIGG